MNFSSENAFRLTSYIIKKDKNKKGDGYVCYQADTSGHGAHYNPLSSLLELSAVIRSSEEKHWSDSGTLILDWDYRIVDYKTLTKQDWERVKRCMKTEKDRSFIKHTTQNNNSKELISYRNKDKDFLEKDYEYEIEIDQKFEIGDLVSYEDHGEWVVIATCLKSPRYLVSDDGYEYIIQNTKNENKVYFGCISREMSLIKKGCFDLLHETRLKTIEKENEKAFRIKALNDSGPRYYYY